MTVTYTWTGILYQDCASLFVGGVYYRLYTYLNLDDETVEGVLYLEQENGQDVLVERRTIYQSEGLGTSRLKPRCIATEEQFYVFWTEGGDLHRWRINPTTGAWATGSVLSGVMHASELYDVHTLRSGNSHVVCYKNLAGNLNVRRYDGSNWTHAWATTISHEPINCLGCYGDDTDGWIFVAYQELLVPASLNLMQLSHLNVTTGGHAGTVEAFDVSPSSVFADGAEWSRCGLAKISEDEIALVAEGRLEVDPMTHFSDRFVAYKAFEQDGLADASQEHLCHNVNMQSRPWSYSDGGITGTRAIYCVLGYKDSFHSKHSGWAQHFAYVCNMAADDWGEPDMTVRPYSVCNLTLNTIDSRPGYLSTTIDPQNLNHLPGTCDPVNYGPNTKTRTIPLIEFGRIGVRSSTSADLVTRAEPIPLNATVTGFKFHHEDTWTYYREQYGPQEPPNDAENYLGPYPYAQFRNLEIGDGMFIGGGCPAIYDGKQIVEMGFLWAPELKFKSATDNGMSAGLASGSYYWTAVYEWRDNAGQLHRSAPASPVFRSLDFEGNIVVVLYCRTMTLTLKGGHRYEDAPAIEIILYRTEDQGSVFYRVYGDDGIGAWGAGTIENTPKNDPTVAVIDLQDQQIDSNLAASEPLPYQLVNGQWVPLTNWPPPACGAFATWQNRLWYASSEDGAQLWYSKAILPENGGVRYAVPEMNPVNVYRLDDGGGIVTGMQAMDYGLVVFKRASIFLLNGEANQDNGAGASLDHQTLAIGTGCVDPRSIVLTPSGVFFQSEKGYYLLDRSQNLDYVSAGADVEDLFRIAGNIKSAELIPNRHQIRIIMNETVTGLVHGTEGTIGGRYVLIYDYLMKAWSRADIQPTSQNGWISTLIAGRTWRGLEGENLHVVLTQNRLLIERDREQDDSYEDQDWGSETLPIRMDVQTGWIRDSLSRQTKVKEIIIEASKPNDSSVDVDVDYEVNGTWDDTLTDTFSWVSPAPTTMRIKPRVKKLTGFRVRIHEPIGVPATENIKLQSITYVVGRAGKTRSIGDGKVGT